MLERFQLRTWSLPSNSRGSLVFCKLIIIIFKHMYCLARAFVLAQFALVTCLLKEMYWYIFVYKLLQCCQSLKCFRPCAYKNRLPPPFLLPFTLGSCTNVVLRSSSLPPSPFLVTLMYKKSFSPLPFVDSSSAIVYTYHGSRTTKGPTVRQD